MSQDDAGLYISLGSLKRYLTAEGWARSPQGGAFEVFHVGNGSRRVEIILPKTADRDQSSRWLANAVDTLSAMTGNDPRRMASILRAVSCDILNSRLPDSTIRQDTISLSTAQSFINRLTRIIVATAQAELDKQPYYVRPFNAATQFSEDCRFGHTFRGSFGFTVEAPVGPQTQEVLTQEHEVPPLGRRVIRRFARGLSALGRAVEAGDYSPLVGAYNVGLNANGCDEIQKLIEESGAERIHFDFAFSPEWGYPSDVGAAPVFSVGTSSLPVLQKASAQLRRIDDDLRRVIQGKIVALQSREDPSDLFSPSGSRTVTIQPAGEEFAGRLVKADISPEAYLLAVDAHRQGDEVSIAGQLDQGNRGKLVNITAFKVLPGNR